MPWSETYNGNKYTSVSAAAAAAAAVMSLDTWYRSRQDCAAVDCRYQMSINIVMSLPCGGFVWNWLIGQLEMPDRRTRPGRPGPGLDSEPRRPGGQSVALNLYLTLSSSMSSSSSTTEWASVERRGSGGADAMTRCFRVSSELRRFGTENRHWCVRAQKQQQGGRLNTLQWCKRTWFCLQPIKRVRQSSFTHWLK